MDGKITVLPEKLRNGKTKGQNGEKDAWTPGVPEGGRGEEEEEEKRRRSDGASKVSSCR